MSSIYAPVSLSTGTAADIATIDALMRAAFDPRYGESWTAAQCLGMLSLPGVWVTIASLDDVPVGFAMARTMADDGELLLLAVRPDFHARGIGGALLRCAIADARRRGAARFCLEVRAGNPAVRLYERERFTMCGVRRDYYRGARGDCFDAHTYCLTTQSSDLLQKSRE